MQPPAPCSLAGMTPPAIITRIRRLDDLRSRLAAEIVRVPHALQELTSNERAAYLMGIQDALEGFDKARAALAAAAGTMKGR